MTLTSYGFRIVGSCTENRRLVDWAVAFSAYCSCDERAEVNHEGYLSAFTFGKDFDEYLNKTGATKGYDGPCCSSWLWFDIDTGDDLQKAVDQTRRLASFLAERFGVDGDDLLIFFSGSKGFHVGLPLSLCGSPGPSLILHRVCRMLAERLAELAGVTIDAGVYDRVRAFRAPNSQHPKTGLHKRRLSFDELLGVNLDGILQLAAEPAEFDISASPPPNDQAVSDWSEATARIEQERIAQTERRATGGPATLNRSTLDFIRDGAGTGDRHRRLFSAAANLAEFGCPAELAHGLLTEAGLDCGLSPSDVRRQIDCGLNHQPPANSTTLFPVEPPQGGGYYNAGL